MRLEPQPVATEVSALTFRAGSAPAWIGADRIAVSDKDAGQIVLLDLNDGSSTRLGRRGMGPGEMMMPMWVLARPDGSVLVGDGMGSTLTEFDPAGEHRRIAYFPGRPVAVTGWNGDTVSGVWIDGIAPVAGAVVLGADTATEWFRPFDASEVVAKSAETLTGRSLFLIVGSGGGSRILVSGGFTYDVVAFESDGRSVATFSRPDLLPRLMTDEEFKQEAETFTRIARTGGAEAMQHLDEVLATFRKQPRPFFRSNALSTDEEGRLWVATSHRIGSRTAVDVFAPDGSFLTRLEIPGNVASVVPRLPHLMVLREGIGGEKDGIEGIDLYRVIE